MKVIETIRSEITSYVTQPVSLSTNQAFSQYNEVNKIALYRNRTYAYGKLDTQGKYKYWFDIIQPKVNDEVKNIDIDRSNVFFHSDSNADVAAVFILNAKFKQWMRDAGQGEAINEAEEMGAAEGNVVWKKTADGYELIDLTNFYVIIQTARTLKETPVVERHNFSQSALRKMKGIWDSDAIDWTIKHCGNKMYGSSINQTMKQDTEIPFYEIFERNGEISVADLLEAQGKAEQIKPEDEDNYVLAKIVCSGISEKSGQYILFADKIDEMPYIEYHRGPYKGTWLREGLVMLLYDVQTRFNKIGNQIATGLELASKAIFRYSDKMVVQNALTDLMNGSMIRSADLQQVNVRMESLDQLANEWNRLLDIANRIASSFEITTGENLPSGSSFRLAALLNANANKFYGYLQEKFALAYSNIIKDWILPQMVKDIKKQDVVTIMGDEKYLAAYYQMVVDAWYVRNLVAIGPHTAQEAIALKAAKLRELQGMKNQKAQIALEDGAFKGVLKRIQVVITDENYSTADTQALADLAKIEPDPITRSAMIKIIGQRTVRGVDFSNLPRSTPQALQPPLAPPAMPTNPATQPATA